MSKSDYSSIYSVYRGMKAYPALDPLAIDPEEAVGREEGRRKRVWYRGRSWEERDEQPLPVEGHFPAREEAGFEEVLLENCRRLFETLTTLEEKIAQLCMVVTEASYDLAVLKEIEHQILVLQIGGILFRFGDSQREEYLLAHYQRLSKTPLLFGHSFAHAVGLSGREDGAAVARVNRKMGVSLQIENPLSPEPQRATFHKEIVAGRGVIGRVGVHPRRRGGTFSSFDEMSIKNRTLLVCDAMENLDGVRKAFLEGAELFLLPLETVDAAITLLCSAVRKGELSEAEVDRRVLRLLGLFK